MAKEDVLEIEGVVIKIEPNTLLRVKVEMSPYDLSKGRIT